MMRCTIFFACALAIAPVAQAQTVFREDFNPGTETSCVAPPGGPGTYVFPPGWLLRNVDNRVPDAQVSYVNDAWEVREDFGQDVANCVAFSTSYYAPVGQADDWMWTPLIAVPTNAALRWRARTYDPLYPDGYEVRIMPAASGPPTGGSGVIGNQLTGSTQVFAIAAAATTWTPQQVSLASFAGQSVYIGFRNNSNNQFLLVIDDVEVAGVGPDLRAIDPVAPGPWARIPAGLIASTSYRYGLRVTNAGTAASAPVTATATTVRDGVPTAPPRTSDPIPAIDPTQTVTTAWGTTPGPSIPSGRIVTRYAVPVLAGELNTADNTIDSLTLEVGGNELSRYLGSPTGGLGIGAGNGGELATVVEVPSPMVVVGIRLGMLGRSPVTPPDPDNWTGRPVIARIRAADATGVPQDPVLHETQAGVGSRDAVTYDLPFAAPVTLPAGRYAISAVEPVGSEAMQVGMHAQIFEPGLNRVTWPTSPTPGWPPVENFGTAFALTPQIGLLTSLALFSHGFEPAPAGAQAPAAVAPADAVRREPPKAQRLVDAIVD